MKSAHRKIRNQWLISIVSHEHGEKLIGILTDLHRHLENTPFQIALTLNVPEPEGFLNGLEAPLKANLAIIRNLKPKGFGANHNTAISQFEATFVMIADPCLRLPENVFPQLERALRCSGAGIVSPQAYTPNGCTEDNGRALVTPISLVRHYIFRASRLPHSAPNCEKIAVDWLAGLCLALCRNLFIEIGGFDERYFLYCEDVDLSLRTRQFGARIELLPHARVIHAANRDSWRKMRHFLWHISSLARLWRSSAYRWARKNI